MPAGQQGHAPALELWPRSKQDARVATCCLLSRTAMQGYDDDSADYFLEAACVCKRNVVDSWSPSRSSLLPLAAARHRTSCLTARPLPTLWPVSYTHLRAHE